MFNQHLSADFFFRDRHAQPSFTYNYRDPLTSRYASFTMYPAFSIYSINLGLA